MFLGERPVSRNTTARNVPIAVGGDRPLWSIELNRPLLSYAKLSEAAVKAIPATDAISK